MDVPPESQVHRQVVRKEADAHAIEVDPVVKLHYVEVARPDLGRPVRAICERLLEALEREWGLTGARVRPARPAGAAATLARAGGWTATVAVHEGATIIAIWPGFHDAALGIAFDVGSTTVAGHLCDLASGEVLARRRRDEPADPVRRGPDEPRVVRDDAPGLRGGAHRGRAGVRGRA